MFHPFSQNETKYGTILDDGRLCQSWDLFLHKRNDAFRKTLLQAARKKSRKLTDHAEKTTSTACADSNVLIVFSVTRRELWELIGRGEGGKM